MNKTIKIVMVLILVLAMSFSYMTISYAKPTTPSGASTDTGTGGGSSGADINTGDFKPPDLTTNDYSKAFSMGSKIMNVMRAVAIIVAVVGMIAIGIKYMASSAEGKAEYKKTMVPYLFGFVLVFCLGAILGLFADLAAKFG